MLSTLPAEAADAEPPHLPTKLYKPQRRGNIGPGKAYHDEAAFLGAVAAYKVEKAERKQSAAMQDHKTAQHRARDEKRKGSRPPQPSGSANREKYEYPSEADTRQRESKERYARHVKIAHARQPNYLTGCKGEPRWLAETALLGARFADDGQRVRVVSAESDANGCVGTVMCRAILYHELS